MRALFLNPVGTTSWGGVETNMLQMAFGLTDLGHEVVAGGKRGSEFLRNFERQGFPSVPLSLRRDFDPIDLVRLIRANRRHRIDAVLTKLDKGIRLAGLASSLAKGPAIVQYQGAFEVRDGLKHRFAFRWVDYVVTPARAVQRKVVESGVLPPSRVRFVPNGVDADAFRRDPELGRDFRRIAGIPDGPLVVAAGSLHEVKRHELLIDAVAGLPGVQLAIAGRGKLQYGLAEHAARRGAADRVHLLGHREDVIDLLSAADAFALSSRSEGQPNCILEAMAAGLPIVATAVGEVPEMLDHGRVGILVPPEDPEALRDGLRRILRGAAATNGMGRAARERVLERYSLAGSMQLLEEVLSEAIRVRQGRESRTGEGELAKGAHAEPDLRPPYGA